MPPTWHGRTRKDGARYCRTITHRNYAHEIPRKAWEFEFIAQSVENCGLLNGHKAALGIRVGSEPLIFFFARHVRSVIATDLNSPETAG